MLTAVCHNAAGLLGTRFFLGFVESAIAPGLTVVISMWYKRSEQPLRHAAWFLGNTIAGIFGGLLQYGIGHIKTIAPWKGVFLILGGITVAWGLCIFFLLPDTPTTARFLSHDDRAKAVARVKENKTGIKSNHIKWDQIKEALLDIKLWLMVLNWLSYNIPNGGITTVSIRSLYASSKCSHASLPCFFNKLLTDQLASLAPLSFKASDSAPSTRCCSAWCRTLSSWS